MQGQIDENKKVLSGLRSEQYHLKREFDAYKHQQDLASLKLANEVQAAENEQLPTFDR